MKKILASILALCLIFSAFGTALFTVSAEETVTEPETGTETEVVGQTPIYTTTTPDWTFKTTTAKDNTLFNSVLYNHYYAVDVDSVSGFETVFSAESGISLEDMSTWLKNGVGQIRFWVKIPWREETPDLSYYFGVGYNVTYEVVTESDGTTTTAKKTEYPEIHTAVSIPADGLWHEIRISASDFSNSARFDSFIENKATVNAFYGLRVQAVDADAVIDVAGFNCAPLLEYYNEAITAEVNDGNIASEVFLVDSNDTGTGLSGLTYDNPQITDNKFYRTARRLTRTGEESWAAGNIYPFSKTATSDVAELKGWFDNQGEMRTFIKNASDNDITIKIGVKGNFAHSTHTDKYAAIGKSVTLPANEWTEVRISYSDAKPSEKTQDLFTTSDTYYKYWMYIEKNDTMFQNVGDALYITPMEIYNRNIVEDVTTDFEREYKTITTLNKDTSWKKNEDYITRVSTTTDELPFFSNIITYTTTDAFDVNNYSEAQLGYTHQDNVSHAEMAEFVYYNPNAEMRFWIKTEKTISLKFELFFSGTNKAIYVTVEIAGSNDWQQVKIKSSDFNVNNDLNSYLLSESVGISGVTLFIKDITAGLSAGDSFSLSRCVEFYTHEAYDKGDLNRDGAVNVLDLVRTKKFIANAETSFINGDINSDGKLTADDMTYLRKWMITGAWN